MKFSFISHGLSIIKRPKNVINKKKRKIEKRENKELEMGSGDEKVIKKNMERKLFRKDLNKKKRGDNLTDC